MTQLLDDDMRDVMANYIVNSMVFNMQENKVNDIKDIISSFFNEKSYQYCVNDIKKHFEHLHENSDKMTPTECFFNDVTLMRMVIMKLGEKLQITHEKEKLFLNAYDQIQKIR